MKKSLVTERVLKPNYKKEGVESKSDWLISDTKPIYIPKRKY
jgi:hypothetical protein